MGHSVERHLSVAPDDYDAAIRRFVPGYDAMQAALVGSLRQRLAALPEPIVLDLGAGTGALSARVLEALPRARVVLVDADAAMLAKAADRLAAFRSRVELRHGSFLDALPDCDAAVASLALHHVHDPARKRALHAGVRAALRPGGVLLNADAMVAEQGALAADARRAWAAHLVSQGDSEEQALARFAEWAVEDRYFAIADELQLLRDAGFNQLDVVWRAGPMAVLAALKDVSAPSTRSG